MKPCCEKTMGAFEVARASYLTTGTMVAGSGAYSCTRGTTGAAASTKIAGSGTYSCSKQVSTKVAQGSSCTKSATSLAAIPYDAGKRVELTGSVVCGHCDLNCTESCQVVFKTADGKVYLLMDSELVEKMRKKTAESGYKVVTVVRDVDGTKYLDVEKMSAL
jgi:hypothetical protein